METAKKCLFLRLGRGVAIGEHVGEHGGADTAPALSAFVHSDRAVLLLRSMHGILAANL